MGDTVLAPFECEADGSMKQVEKQRVETLAPLLKEDHAALWRSACWTHDLRHALFFCTAAEIDPAIPNDVSAQACEHPLHATWWQCHLAIKLFPSTPEFLWLGHVVGIFDIAGRTLKDYQDHAGAIHATLRRRANAVASQINYGYDYIVSNAIVSSKYISRTSPPENGQPGHLAVFPDQTKKETVDFSDGVSLVRSRLVITTRTDPSGFRFPLCASFGVPVQNLVYDSQEGWFAYAFQPFFRVEKAAIPVPKRSMVHLPFVCRAFYDRGLWYPFEDPCSIVLVDDTVALLHPDRAYKMQLPVNSFHRMIQNTLGVLNPAWLEVHFDNAENAARLLHM